MGGLRKEFKVKEVGGESRRVGSRMPREEFTNKREGKKGASLNCM